MDHVVATAFWVVLFNVETMFFVFSPAMIQFLLEIWKYEKLLHGKIPHFPQIFPWEHTFCPIPFFWISLANKLNCMSPCHMKTWLHNENFPLEKVRILHAVSSRNCSYWVPECILCKSIFFWVFSLHFCGFFAPQFPRPMLRPPPLISGSTFHRRKDSQAVEWSPICDPTK